MAEYLIQDTTLTEIADAIREKDGTTDAIAVTDMAAKIAAIAAGGGDEGGVKIYSGSITATSSTTEKYNVNFGFAPDFLIVYMSSYAQAPVYGMFDCFGISSKLQTATGSNFGSARLYCNGSKFYTYTGGTIDSEDTNNPLYGTDETGFYTGRELVSGKYYQVLAIGGLA